MWTSYDDYIDALKAMAEPTRFRLTRLCARGELTVSELMRIIGQSQPRVSRHLKLLQDAGILESFREQHWVFYRLTRDARKQALIQRMLDEVPAEDAQMTLDASRLDE